MCRVGEEPVTILNFLFHRVDFPVLALHKARTCFLIFKAWASFPGFGPEIISDKHCAMGWVGLGFEPQMQEELEGGPEGSVSPAGTFGSSSSSEAQAVTHCRTVRPPKPLRVCSWPLQVTCAAAGPVLPLRLHFSLGHSLSHVPHTSLPEPLKDRLPGSAPSRPAVPPKASRCPRGSRARCRPHAVCF